MNEQAKAVFDESVIAVLATVNEDGSPWATPVHLVADDVNVYWFSKDSTIHSQNIMRDERVSLSLFSLDESKGPKGVYVNGRAEKLGDDERSIASDLFRKRLTVLPPIFDIASAYRLPLGRFDEQKSTGNCWYFYS